MNINEIIIKEVAKNSIALRNLPLPLILSVIPKLKVKKVKAKEILFKQGDIDSNIYFLYRGILKAYYYEGDKQVVTLFFDSNSFISNSATLFTEGVAWIYIEAITNSTLYYFSKDIFFTLLKESKYIVNSVIESFATAIISHHLKLRNIMKLTAQERYKIFCIENDKILPYLPLKDIASYLNITPETLSRVRLNN